MCVGGWVGGRGVGGCMSDNNVFFVYHVHIKLNVICSRVKETICKVCLLFFSFCRALWQEDVSDLQGDALKVYSPVTLHKSPANVFSGKGPPQSPIPADWQAIHKPRPLRMDYTEMCL